MEKWEYRHWTANHDELPNVLREFNDTDWELVSVVPGMYRQSPTWIDNREVNQWMAVGYDLVFKRRKP